MTTIDRMFASLMVKLVRSIASKGVTLDEFKKFICDLMPQRSFNKSVGILPMFNANLINEISSVRELLMFLKEYSSFCNFSLLKEMINRFGDDDVKESLKMYVTILQELTIQEIPLLLHHHSRIDGFSSDILTVTTTDDVLSFKVEMLLFIRDSIARILQIENFAIIFLQIKKAEKQIKFLIASQVTVKIPPLAFASVKEAHITRLQYREVELNQDQKFYESDDDNNDNIDIEGIILIIIFITATTLILDDSNYEDSGLESSIYASEIEQGKIIV